MVPTWIYSSDGYPVDCVWVPALRPPAVLYLGQTYCWIETHAEYRRHDIPPGMPAPEPFVVTAVVAEDVRPQP